MSDRLSAAAGCVEVTPKPGLLLGGYAVAGRRAHQKLDPLEVNFLHLRDSHGSEVVWISVDVLAIHPHLRDLLTHHISQALGARRSSVIVSASHTHSSPAGWHGQVHPVLPADLDEVECERVAEVVSNEAHRADLHRCSVRAHWGRATVHGVGSNRHDKEGPHKDDLAALTIVDDTGTVRAVMFDYACHPTVLGPDSTAYSADWVGAARAHIRTRTSGSGAIPVVFLQGPAGDVSARFNRRSRTAAEVTRLGTLVGEAAVIAVHNSSALDDTQITVRQRNIIGPTRGYFSPRGELATPRLALTPTRVEQSRNEGIAAIRAFAAWRPPQEITSRATLVRVGPLSWFHHAFELATCLDPQITCANPNLRTIGYTDSYAGYLADASSHDRGDYEALASFFDAETTTDLVVQLASAAGSANDMDRSYRSPR